jgi:acetoacetyl-CoA synthetase
MNEVSDSLILFLEDPEDRASGELLLFVVAAKEADWHLLPDQIRSELRKQGSPRHVPDRIIPVEDIPYTLSGKKMEVPMKRILRGEKPENVLNPDAIRNPEAIDFFVRYFHHHIHKTT